jgi:hypothetical protein
LRHVIRDVVEKYLRCGDLKEGFARVKCKDCQHEFLLAFSCQSRWLCPSCQGKKVIMFGDHLKNNVLYPVPHRQYEFGLPIMLRGYFKYDRKLLSKLCRCAYDSLHLFFKTHINLKKGVPGAAMVVHTFGNAPDKYHPHVHLIAMDGLFADTGTFYVMRDVDLKPLEEIFRAKILKMLQKEGKIDQEMISKLLKWKHSGFGIDNGVRIKKNNAKGREAIAQYIIDVSSHHPRRLPSLTWRNCIMKIYEIDPLECPRCGGEMHIVSFIHQSPVIRKILGHLGLWDEDHSRGPPQNDKVIYEPIDDGWFREIVDEATTIISF